jgi:hypothetical protein
MVIQGINAVSGFNGPKPAERPELAPAESQTPPSDTVEVSAEGAGVAAARKALQESAGSEIREEQVEAAKARLAEGAYKLQATVLQVAARVAAFVG